MSGWVVAARSGCSEPTVVYHYPTKDHLLVAALERMDDLEAEIQALRDWVQGASGLRSMGVPSTGAYGVDEGLMSSFPLRLSGGGYEIVEGLDVGDYAQAKIDITVNELREERDAVKELGLV